MQRRAISIVHSFLQSLGVMSGMYPRETQALVEPHLRDWMDLFLSVMASPVTVEVLSGLCNATYLYTVAMILSGVTTQFYYRTVATH